MVRMIILAAIGFVFLANFVFAQIGIPRFTVCDPRPLGGYSCPASCDAYWTCAPGGGGFTCTVAPGAVPGWCKAATAGSCGFPYYPCPGTCIVGGAPCNCAANPSEGLGPC
jgi:hypothetical protein